MLKREITFSLVSLIAGAILPLAFAPFGCYLIAEASLITLILIWQNTNTAKKSFWYGWLFGLAFFSCGIYWVYISIHDFGHAPVILAVAILALLIMILALYPAVLGYLLKKTYKKDTWYKWILIFPVSWIALEWFRGWFLSGFPWLFLGYGHIDSALGGWATVGGVYGGSFMIAQTAGAIVCMYNYRKNLKLITIFAMLVAAIWSGGYCLKNIKWSSPIQPKSIQVSLVQGNVSLERKWDPDELLPIIKTYSGLTNKNFQSRIIVWPEAAIPAYPQEVDYYLQRISKTAKAHNTAIITGVPFYDEKNDSYYNGMLVLGKGKGHYYKRHLVPFGEYLPLSFMLKWLDNYLLIPMSGFTSGSDKQPDLVIVDYIIAPFVCYEIAYAGLVLEYLPKASLLVTVSDDSWFGESIAADQHLEIARMRSLEVGRYQLLCTNTGITAVIDSHGKVLQQLPIFEQGVLTSKVEMLSYITPWVRWGRYIWVVFLGILLVFCIQRKFF